MRAIRHALTLAVLLCAAAPANAIPVAVFVSIGLSTLAATIAAVIVNIGLSLLVGALFGPKTPKPKAEANATTLQLGENPRQALFGRVATAGSLVDAYDQGGKYDTKFETVIFAIADHKCQALVGLYVNDTYYTFTGDGPLAGYPGNDSPDYALVISWRDGSPGQTLPATLVPGSDTPGTGNSGLLGDGGFTDADFTGISYITAAYKADKPGTDNPKFPAGRPHFLFVVDGKLCYDPRKDGTVTGGSGSHLYSDPTTWEWTDNPIVCRYNWVRGVYALDLIDQPEQLLVGRGLTATEAPPENVAAYANTCDEEVALGIGGVEKRYTCSAVINADEDYIAVEEKFAACCAGIIIQPSGSVEVEPGVAKVASFSITDDDLIVGAPVKFSNFRSDSDDAWVNTVVPRYPEPSQKYQDHAAPLRRDYADIIADGKAREQTLTLDYVTSGTQAQRCGEIDRRLGRLPRTATITLGPRFAEIEEGDWGDWTSARYFNGDVVEWRVEGYNLDEKWQNTLSLREIASSVYDWDTSMELDDGSIAGSPTTPPGPLAAPVVGDWTLSGETIAGAGGSMPALLITGAVPDDTIEAIDKIIFEYRLYVLGQADDAGWGGASQEPVTTVKKEILGIAPDTEYDVSVRYAVRGYVGARLILNQAQAGTINTPSSELKINPASPITVRQKSDGTAQTGQYPLNIQVSRLRGGIDVTATSDFEITNLSGLLTGSNTTINDTEGDPNRGRINVIDDTGGTGTSPSGTISISVTRSGEQDLTSNIVLSPVLGAAASATLDNSLNSITSTSDTVISDVLNITPTGTSVSCTAASIAFWTGSGGTHPYSSNIKLKWQYSSTGVGAWSDVAAYVTGTAEQQEGVVGKGDYYPGDNGLCTCNQSKTGLSAGVAAYFRLMGQAVSTPSDTIHLSGTAQIA